MKRIILGITERCNTQCNYCYISKTKKQNQMNKEVADKAITFFLNLSKDNNNSEKQLILTGGEPLLAYELIQYLIIKYKKVFAAQKIVVGVPTNGILLNSDKLKFLKQNKLLLSLSWDGLRSKARQYKNLNIKKRLDLLKDYRDYVRIRMSISPQESGDLFKNFYYLYKLDFKRFDIQPVLGFFWPKEQCKQYLANLEKILKIAIKDENLNLKILDPKNNFKHKCPAITEELFINWDGNIYPCQFFMSLPEKDRNKYILGNVLNYKKLSLNDLNYKICELNQFIEKKSKCQQCEQSTACTKLCLAYNIKSREFDPLLASNFWTFERAIEKLLIKYGEMESAYEEK